MPTPKKHSSTRARRNVAATATTMGNTSRREGVAAPLPAGLDWHPAVQAWWEAMWAAPMSDEYHDSDLHQLYILAGLYHAFYTCPDDKLREKLAIAAEIRLQRATFGLTPYDRRRLEWTIETTEDAKDKGRARRQRQATPPMAAADDPRRGLRTVG